MPRSRAANRQVHPLERIRFASAPPSRVATRARSWATVRWYQSADSAAIWGTPPRDQGFCCSASARRATRRRDNLIMPSSTSSVWRTRSTSRSASPTAGSESGGGRGGGRDRWRARGAEDVNVVDTRATKSQSVEWAGKVASDAELRQRRRAVGDAKEGLADVPRGARVGDDRRGGRRRRRDSVLRRRRDAQVQSREPAQAQALLEEAHQLTSDNLFAGGHRLVGDARPPRVRSPPPLARLPAARAAREPRASASPARSPARRPPGAPPRPRRACRPLRHPSSTSLHPPPLPRPASHPGPPSHRASRARALARRAARCGARRAPPPAANPSRPPPSTHPPSTRPPPPPSRPPRPGSPARPLCAPQVRLPPPDDRPVGAEAGGEHDGGAPRRGGGAPRRGQQRRFVHKLIFVLLAAFVLILALFGGVGETVTWVVSAFKDTSAVGATLASNDGHVMKTSKALVPVPLAAAPCWPEKPRPTDHGLVL